MRTGVSKWGEHPIIWPWQPAHSATRSPDTARRGTTSGGLCGSRQTHLTAVLGERPSPAVSARRALALETQRG